VLKPAGGAVSRFKGEVRVNLRKIFILLNALIVGLILLVGVDIALTWHDSRNGEKTGALARVERETGNRKPRRGTERIGDFQGIVQKNIFKTAPAPARPKKAEPEKGEEIKLTDLNLSLQGTVIGENSESFAVIQDGKTRKQDIYYLNDTVGGAKITKILSDRVILSLKGREEALVISYERGPAPRRRRITPRRRPRRPIIRRPSAARTKRPIHRFSGRRDGTHSKREE